MTGAISGSLSCGSLVKPVNLTALGEEVRVGRFVRQR
jgi:hypothetical protein